MGWFSSYAYRKELTVLSSDVPSDQTDFPIWVKLSSSNFNFNKAKADGSDIAFTAEDGVTPLSFERDFFGYPFSSDLTAEGTLSASSVAGAGFEADKAGDNNSTTQWSSTNTALPHWLRIDFGEGNEKAVIQYSIQARSSFIGRSPNTWQLQGSNNGSDWSVLDSQSGIVFSASERKFFSFSNTTNYRYYRLNCTANNGDASWIQISEWELMSQGEQVGSFWVKIPALSSSVDTKVYMYYGLPSADDLSEREIWDSDYKAVWHLAEVGAGASNEFVDSTGNEHHGVMQGQIVPGTSVNGRSQRSAGGTSNFIQVADHDDFYLSSGSNWTIEWKMRWVDSVVNGTIMGQSNGSSGSDPKFLLNYGTLGAGSFHALWGSGAATVSFIWSPSANTDYHCVIKRESNTYKFFVNNVQVGGDKTSATNGSNSSAAFALFKDTQNFASFTGILDEVRITKGAARSDDYIELIYESERDSLLSFGAEEEAFFGTLQWGTVKAFQEAVSLDWRVAEEAELFPALEWNLQPGQKFIPNLVHYPLYFPEPEVVSSIVPLVFTGCIAGASIYLRNTGTDGVTTIEFYAGGVLRETREIPADETEYTRLYHFYMNYLVEPGDNIEIKVTTVAEEAVDLKIDLYQMTFPFELEEMFHGNIQDGVQFSGIDKNYFFASADSWFIEFNQPVQAVDTLTIIDTNGVATFVEDSVIETGFFYNNRVKFDPFLDAPVDHIQIRVKDYHDTFYTFNIYPIVTAFMANYPDFISETLASSEIGDTDLTTGKTASATAGVAGDAIDDVEGTSSGEYWTSGDIGFPVQWAVDLGAGNAKLVRKLRVKPYSNAFGVAFKDFQVWGSNTASPVLSTDADWSLIFTGTAEANSDWQEFEFSNDTAYRHYRITIESNYRSDGTAAIQELELLEGIDTYSSSPSVDLYIGATQYRLSFDNGSTFEDWVEVPDTHKILLDFEDRAAETYDMVIEYLYGDKVLSDSFEVFYAPDELQAGISFIGSAARITYSDVVPLNRVEVYYDEVLVHTVSPTIVSSDAGIDTDDTAGEIILDPITVYFENQKFEFDGTPYAVQPDINNNYVQYRVYFGFNMDSKLFEFRETQYVNTPSVFVLEDAGNFLVLWAVDYTITILDQLYTTYSISFGSTFSNFVPTDIPVELQKNRDISISVYDIAGRYVTAELPYVKTKLNIWRTVTVSSRPLSSSYQDDGSYLAVIDNITNAASPYWSTQPVGTLPQWVRYDFGNGNPKTAVEYTVRIRNVDANSKPTAWKLQGSNNGTAWTDLDTVSGETWANDGPKTYTIDASEAYTSYRLLITATSGGVYVSLREWELRLTPSGADILDPDATQEILPGELHGFNALDYTVDSEDWEDPI